MIFGMAFHTTGEPSIKRGPEEVVIGVADSGGENLTQSATFECTAIGLPPLQISWFYLTITAEGELGSPRKLTDGVTIINTTEPDLGGRISITSQLTISVLQDNGGVIRCQAGSAHQDARLTVLGMCYYACYIE